MSLFRDRWAGYWTTGLVTFTAGITLYLVISDAARRSEIRRRKKKLLSTTIDSENSLAVLPLERVQHRYGVLQIGGRFVNPFEEFRILALYG